MQGTDAVVERVAYLRRMNLEGTVAEDIEGYALL
jgi:hypothetical protein